MVRLYLVVETLEKTSSSTSHLPSGIKRNVLGIYDSFERAYSEAEGYFNVTKIEDYACIVLSSEVVKSVLYSNSVDSQPTSLVAKEKNISYAPTDGSIWSKEVRSIYIEVRKVNQPIY